MYVTTEPLVIHVLCCISQKVDDQNSMDTSQNDIDTAAEHSLPNNSEVAEVQSSTLRFLLEHLNISVIIFIKLFRH